MSMPSFVGAMLGAVAEGQSPAQCWYCGNWTWVDRDHVGHVWCGRKDQTG
jgi:hypothetical protein